MPATPTLPNWREKEKSNRVLEANVQPPTIQPDPLPKKEGEKAKRCPFHDLNGHILKECLAFHAKSLDEGNEWLDFATVACRRDTRPVTVRRT